MAKNKSLKYFATILNDCVKCGICQAHCPTYLVGKREGAVARGKIALAAALLNKEVGLEKCLQDDISMCLMCGSCVNTCPNRVPTHEIVGAIRREITNNQGLSPMFKGISTLLGSKTLIKTAAKGGAMLTPLVFKKVPKTSGLRLRFPIPIMKNRTVPKISHKNLFDRVPEFIQGDQNKPVIGFFAGCSITYAYPKIGESMLAILVHMGYSVHIPRAQKCCGIPALSSGDGQLVETLATANVSAFENRELQAIITACASCNGGIGEYYKTMHGDLGDFTAKVIDFSVFLKSQGLIEELAGMRKKRQRLRVTYHDPCHLKIQGITKEPRELLQAMPNVDFIEMENASSCCGFGGTFSVYHYDTSKAIGARKVPGLTKTKANFVATSCPGCIIGLQDIINHAGLEMQAVHILELLEKAYIEE